LKISGIYNYCGDALGKRADVDLQEMLTNKRKRAYSSVSCLGARSKGGDLYNRLQDYLERYLDKIRKVSY